MENKESKRRSVLKVNKDFCITEDHLDNIRVPDDTLYTYKSMGYTNFFRLYDDDDNLYYSGYLHKDMEGEDEFIPLDWAMYDSGCTYIKYRNPKTGKMEIL